MYRYIGKPLRRIENLPLLRGRGRFIDDLKFTGMLEAVFVRSPHAHALVRKVDTLEARNLSGVHAIFTFADLAPILSDERLPLQFRSAHLPPALL